LCGINDNGIWEMNYHPTWNLEQWLNQYKDIALNKNKIQYLYTTSSEEAKTRRE